MAKTTLRRFGFVFRGAFGLNFIRLKYAIGTEAAIGERLGVVVEGVGKRIGAGVKNIQRSWALMQDKRYAASGFENRTRLNFAANAHPVRLRVFPHLLEFGNGFVIGLGIFHTAHCQPNKRADDKDHEGAKLQIGLHNAGKKLLLVYDVSTECRPGNLRPK